MNTIFNLFIHPSFVSFCSHSPIFSLLSLIPSVSSSYSLYLSISLSACQSLLTLFCSLYYFLFHLNTFSVHLSSFTLPPSFSLFIFPSCWRCVVWWRLAERVAEGGNCRCGLKWRRQGGEERPGKDRTEERRGNQRTEQGKTTADRERKMERRCKACADMLCDTADIHRTQHTTNNNANHEIHMHKHTGRATSPMIWLCYVCDCSCVCVCVSVLEKADGCNRGGLDMWDMTQVLSLVKTMSKFQFSLFFLKYWFSWRDTQFFSAV